MTNKELLQITDELLANFYKKQVILYHTNVKFIQDFYKQINKYQQTQPRGVWLDQEKQKKYYELWQNIKKFNNLRVGDVISVCNIINNDELTENVKKEIEKNLSDEYKLIRLLTRIVKNQEEKLNNS